VGDNVDMSATTAIPKLPATLSLGAVHLTVTDLDRSMAFYQDAIGLRLHARDDTLARLGAGGDDLLVLVENPRAAPAGRHAGLYHLALLSASREELARAVVRLAASNTPIDGASDHGVSEAIYLSDPDRNGIELYADRPRDRWPAPSEPGEHVGMPTVALDMPALLSVVAGEQPRPHAGPGLSVGHLHLYVGAIDRGLAFYRDVLGFELTALLPGAAFVAAGGYHHHLGFNVWRGQGIPPAPPDTVGLHHWTVVLESADQLAEVRRRVERARLQVIERGDGFQVKDPWDIRVTFGLRAGPAAA
jgi:catechol 2,3-dioxygenase